MSLKEDALEYHAGPPPGKLEIAATKPCLTQRDLALAYSPGVAAACDAIVANPDDAFKLTARGNFVAVVTNGTAVLGLGNIGPLAAKPVMEGKALLFKRFADIDAIDLCLDAPDPEQFINACKAIEPSFGGINLEDIKAPECFVIEERLKREMNIPVIHDDQHGTAIISGAALLNALELANKNIEDVRIVFSGAGAAALATARFYVHLGAHRENIIMSDLHGVVYAGRSQGMNPYMAEFAAVTHARTLSEIMREADVFVGLSVSGLVSKEMIASMAKTPIVFALANPDPEISYEDAKAARPDAIVATGRSDYPNQVNNVLGFPFIFRGALDVRATTINDEMKVAASRALAALAREDVPESVVQAYGLESLRFGPDYLIPKPVDSRILLWEAPAVAEAAMRSGVARVQIDLALYREQLEARLGKSREMMRIVFNKAKSDLRRVVLVQGENERMIRAAYQLADERLARPVLLGNEEQIRKTAASLQLDLNEVEIENPATSAHRESFAQRIYWLRHRKGVRLNEANEMAGVADYFGSIMVEQGLADAMITGLGASYPDSLRPPLQIIGTQIQRGSTGFAKRSAGEPQGIAVGALIGAEVSAARRGVAAGIYLVTTRNRFLFVADVAVNIEPDAETLAEIAILTAHLARDFDVEPRVAMLSFSNFGSVNHPRTELVRRATEIVRRREPKMAIDGEMQATVALSEEQLNTYYPFNNLRKEANVLIFPSLEAGNIAYKMVQRLANAEVVGPILVGMARPVHVLQRGDQVKDIVNLAALAAVDAQRRGRSV
ncbi:MAG: NADP-dependent malic enzyme [Candidatus Sumerlaeaceae bacterium]